MNIRKLLSMLLVGAMLLAALPGAVLADEDAIEVVDAAEVGEATMAEGEDAPAEGGELELFVETDGEEVEEAAPELVGEDEIAEAEPAEATDAAEPVANAGEVAVDAAHFPDAGFLTWVKDNADTDKDGVLSKAEQDAVTDIFMYDEKYLELTSLKGIGYFTGLKELGIEGSTLTSLDLSANTKLVYLTLDDNNYLTSLNVKNCVNLEVVDVRNCYDLASLDVSTLAKLETLDIVGTEIETVNLKGCIKLKGLYCESSNLKTLDISWNHELVYINCNYCKLTSLDVSENTLLKELMCFGNGLVKLELGANDKLETLQCEFNKLTELKLDGCTGLGTLRCQYNKLKALDVDRCTKLHELQCQGNGLSELGVWNCPNLASLVNGGNPSVETDYDYDDHYMGVKDCWDDGGFVSLQVDHDLPVYGEAPKVTGVWLNREGVLMFTEDVVQLKATVVPENPVNGPVNWTTSNASVAIVEDGAVEAVGAGKATITATSVADPSKKATCAVTVQAKVSGKSLKKTGSNGSLKVNKGKQIQLNPDFADDKGWEVKNYKSSNKKIASVDQDGLVTALKKGEVTITATTTNKKQAKIKIKVQDPTIPTKIVLNKKKTVTVKLGTPLYLKATLTPSTAVTKLKWKTSNRRAATVSKTGVVTPVKEGQTVITVSTENGKSARVIVKVVDPTIPTKVALNKKSTVTLKVGETLQLEGKLSPSTAVTTLKWSSDAKKIASVDKDGLVTALKKGKATITVKTKNGKTATVKIKVK